MWRGRGLKASGPGWQTRMNEALKKVVVRKQS
ncbi:BrnA antitoxin family protein [Castellaniella sp. FW104-16D08]